MKMVAHLKANFITKNFYHWKTINFDKNLFETAMQVTLVDIFCLFKFNVRQKLSESEFCV